MKKSLKIVFILCLILGIVAAGINFVAAGQKDRLAEIEAQQAARKQALAQIEAAESMMEEGALELDIQEQVIKDGWVELEQGKMTTIKSFFEV